MKEYISMNRKEDTEMEYREQKGSKAGFRKAAIMAAGGFLVLIAEKKRREAQTDRILRACFRHIDNRMDLGSY